jgi:hypothetical protein
MSNQYYGSNQWSIEQGNTINHYSTMLSNLINSIQDDKLKNNARLVTQHLKKIEYNVYNAQQKINELKNAYDNVTKMINKHNNNNNNRHDNVIKTIKTAPYSYYRTVGEWSFVIIKIRKYLEKAGISESRTCLLDTIFGYIERNHTHYIIMDNYGYYDIISSRLNYLYDYIRGYFTQEEELKLLRSDINSLISETVSNHDTSGYYYSVKELITGVTQKIHDTVNLNPNKYLGFENGIAYPLNTEDFKKLILECLKYYAPRETELEAKQRQINDLIYTTIYTLWLSFTAEQLNAIKEQIHTQTNNLQLPDKYNEIKAIIEDIVPRNFTKVVFDAIVKYYGLKLTVNEINNYENSMNWITFQDVVNNPHNATQLIKNKVHFILSPLCVAGIPCTLINQNLINHAYYPDNEEKYAIYYQVRVAMQTQLPQFSSSEFVSMEQHNICNNIIKNMIDSRWRYSFLRSQILAYLINCSPKQREDGVINDILQVVYNNRDKLGLYYDYQGRLIYNNNKMQEFYDLVYKEIKYWY